MKFYIALLSLFLIPSCGFEPVYGINHNTPVGVEDKLAHIEIGPIPDRTGQYLRNALIDRFYRDHRPDTTDYLLTVSPIAEKQTDLDLTKTADSTRGQLRITTTLTLTDQRTGAKVLERSLRTTTSYNQLSSEFATRVTEDNARTNALNDLASQIELQLNLYFKRV